MTIKATPSQQIKRLHTHLSGLSLKQFAREIKGPAQPVAREWFANKRRHPKKRATPDPGHAGLNWKRCGKKKASRGSSSPDKSGKKKSKDKQR